MPCYGLAENALAVSFSDEAPGLWLTKWIATSSNIRVKPSAGCRDTRRIDFRQLRQSVAEHGIEIRNEAGMPVAERVVGIFASPVPV